MLAKLCLYFLTTITLTNAVRYDLNQLRGYIEDMLQCLERQELLSPDSTFQAAVALNYETQILLTLPNLNEHDYNIVNSYINRLKAIIEKSIDAYPDNPGKYLWRSSYWSTTGDYSFSVGRIPKEPLLPKPLQQIINESIDSPESNQCFLDLYIDNGQSDNPRYCNARCQYIMDDPNYEGAINPKTKALYIGFMMIYNCTNYTPDEYEEKVVYFCKYTKREVDATLYYKNDPLFDKNIEILLQKVYYCSGWGLGEFLEKDILATVVEKIGCEGCFSDNNFNNEDKIRITAILLTILSAAQRMELEEIYSNTVPVSRPFRG